MKKKIHGAVVVADRKDRAGRRSEERGARSEERGARCAGRGTRDEGREKVTGFWFLVSGWLNNAKHETGNAKRLTLQKPKLTPKLSVVSSPRNQGMV